MAPPLQPTGTLYYNGVTFSTFTVTEVSVKPVYDASGRTKIYNVSTLTVKAQLQSDLGTDATLSALRFLLTQPGGRLIFEAHGFGSLSVNNAQIAAGPPLPAGFVPPGLPAGAAPVQVLPDEPPAVRDVLWGPKPTLLQWRNIAGGRAAEITWQVEVAIPECGDPKYEKAIMETNYRVHYSIDRGGYSRRTYSGFFRIPQTRKSVNDPTLQDIADNYREKIVPGLLPNFRRGPWEFQFDESKCRCDFTVTDEELQSPNVPPNGVVEVSAEHEFATRQTPNDRGGANLWSGRISASYEMSADVPREQAFFRFKELLDARTADARQRGKGFILRSFLMREPEIYGRKAAMFTAFYTVSTTIPSLLEASGLWKPVDRNWNTWSRSLSQTAFHPRGNAKLALAPSMDALIDLCVDNTALKKPAEKPSQAGRIANNQRRGADVFRNQQPDPKNSWMFWNSDFFLEVIDSVIEMKQLPQGPVLTPGGGLTPQQQQQLPPTSPADPNNLTLQQIGQGLAAIQQYKKEGKALPAPGGIIQYRTAPRVYLHFYGEAIRAGYAINPPVLKQVQGIPCKKANRPGDGFSCKVKESLFGLKIFHAVWWDRYLLPRVPADVIVIPRNPFA